MLRALNVSTRTQAVIAAGRLGLHFGAMPADAASVSDLTGMGIELRTPSGNVLFAGVIPEFR